MKKLLYILIISAIAVLHALTLNAWLADNNANQSEEIVALHR